MRELFNISHPFLTVEDFERRTGSRQARLIHRLAGKYPMLPTRSGRERMLMALSVAWEMACAAMENRRELLWDIDQALTPYHSLGYVLEPPGGCVAVEHRPFVIIDDDEPGIRNFLWDGFAIFIELEGTDHINQDFFDLAEKHQCKAYIVMGEERTMEHSNNNDNQQTEDSVKETNIRQKSNIQNTNNQQSTVNSSETASSPGEITGEMERRMTSMEDKVDKLLALVPLLMEALNAAVEEINDKISKKMGENVYNIQGDFVQGDKVMGNKYVGVPETADNARVKAALERLMEEKEPGGKPLFQTQSQWYAVFRILCDEYAWGNSLSNFCRRINCMGVPFRVVCKLDGLKKVNVIMPFFKPFSEWSPQGNQASYVRQHSVAKRFAEIMAEEMG